jgi:hypothetical protein
MPKSDDKSGPQKPRGLLSFWAHGLWEAFKEAWEAFNHALVVGIIIYLVFALLVAKCPTFSKWMQSYSKDFDMSQWIEIYIPCIFGAVFLLWCVIRAPYKIYKELFLEIENLKEFLAPKFKLSCSKDIEGCAIPKQAHAIRYFRVLVETECTKGIEHCSGNLEKITKDGQVIYEGDATVLPFAKSEDSDSTSKMILAGRNYWLDVLAVRIYHMDVTDYELYKVNPNLVKNHFDTVAIATKPHSPAHGVNHGYIFGSTGEYILFISVSGRDVPPARIQLKFTWTGKGNESTIEKVG